MNPAEQRGQADGDGLDLQPARLGLGHVEQVVHQRDQSVGRVQDQLKLAARRVGGVLEQQPGESHDRVQRRAQFMADAGPEPGLGLRRLAQPFGFVVQLRVERDDALVGLLELVGKLLVQGHHTAVGLLQLGVDRDELFLLPLQVVQGRDQVLIVPAQLVQGGGREHRGEPPAGGAQVNPGARRAPLGQPHVRPGRGEGVHEARGRRHAGAGQQALVRDRDVQRAAVRREHDRGRLARDHHVAADLADGRGHPDLVLAVEPELGGDLPAKLARGEDPGSVPELEASQLGGHGFSTSTPASSRRTAASPSSMAAMTSGSLATRPGSARMSQRLVSPSECSTTAAPGGRG